LRKFSILLLILTLGINACDSIWPENKDKIVRQKVYVIDTKPDSLDGHLAKLPSDTSYLELVFKNNGLVNILELDSSIQVDLRYADTNNFLHLNLYDGLDHAYLNCEAALKLCNAQYFLKRINPAYSLVIFDASRPLHIQQMMWDSLKLPVEKKYQYLSPPKEPSLHNYGCAVDVSILDMATMTLLDMGTDFDHFEKLSEPAEEKTHLKSGDLSQEAYKNRLLLRAVMQRAKYNPITTEWWHFSICTKPEANKRFKVIQ